MSVKIDISQCGEQMKFQALESRYRGNILLKEYFPNLEPWPIPPPRK